MKSGGAIPAGSPASLVSVDTMSEEVVGRVAAIRVYPVRSTVGRDLPSVEVGAGGLEGDRAWVAVGPDGAVLRGKDAPGLAAVATTGEPVADAAAIGAALGVAVTLAPAEQRDDVAPVHLVSRGAINRAARGEVPEGCSADDPRANLLLEIDHDERSWVDRTVTVGTAVLRVTRTPRHCLGVYADVHTPGRVEVGDPVRLRS
jgi:uncharacterized protein